MSANNVDVLVTLLLSATNRAALAGALLAKTRAEDRQPTEEEMQAFYTADDQVRASLQTAIDQAKSGAVLAKGPVWGNL